MKNCKKIVSVGFITLILACVFMLTAYAAGLKITSQPKTCYTAYGKTATVTVKAKGDGLKYTWYIKNSGQSKYKKSSVTKSSYSVKMTDSTKDRQIRCVIKDKYGKTVKSDVATLRMSASITTQPKTAYAKLGDTAKVTVKAKGDGLKYTWYIKNSGDSKYKKSSVTKSSYSVKMTDNTKDRKLYCVAKDKYGKTVKSDAVTLRMSATITTQPKTASVKLGDTAKVTVKAKGDGLKYTWYIKNDGSKKYSKSSISAATYSVKMTDKVNNRYLYCVVTDKYGKTDESVKVSLKIKETPLTITKQPENAVASVGDEVGFGIVVTGGKQPYTYQLMYTLGNNSWKKYENAEVFSLGNMTDLVFVAKEEHFTKQYRFCISVTDAVGKKITSDEVCIEQKILPLEIEKQPETTSASVGDEVGFGIVVTGGKQPYIYQLMYTFDDNGWMEYENAEVLSLGNMTNLVFRAEDECFTKQYKFCISVTDAEGNNITSDEVCVEQLFLPLEIEKQPEIVSAAVGDKVTFSVKVSGGTAPYNYEWYYICDSFLDWTNMAGGWAPGYTTDTVSFVIDSREFTAGYRYRCIITDSEGDQVISDEVYVVEK